MASKLQPHLPPSSILILGAGAFGLSTAHALLLLPAFASGHITIVDAQLPAFSDESKIQAAPVDLPLPASYDSSRLIRPDYDSAPYARLVTRAQEHWRSNPIFSPFYHESGVVLVADEDLFSQDFASKSHASASSPAIIEAGPLTPSVTTGAAYVRSALENIRTLHAADNRTTAATKSLPTIEVLPNSAAIVAAMGPTEGGTGVSGYLNRRAGWADATGALASLRQRVAELGKINDRVRWVKGKAEQLLFEPVAASTATPNDGSTGRHRIRGALVCLTDPPRTEALHAEFTILALGAYTARLLPRTLGPHLAASAQTLAYVRLDESEAQKLASIPVLLNLSSGFFVVPPTPESADQKLSARAPSSTVLKVARHAHGWRRTELVPDIEPGLFPGTATASSPAHTTTKKNPSIQLPISIPIISRQRHLPSSADAALRAFLATAVPALAHHHCRDAWAHERVCWYSETATGDFLVDRVPGYDGVLCAAGGSGHAFKFLPVLGGLVVALLERMWGLESGGSGDASTKRFGGTERAKESVEEEKHEHGKEEETEQEPNSSMEWDAVTARALEVEEMAVLWRWRHETGEAYGDGSRGGEKGLRWNDEW